MATEETVPDPNELLSVVLGVDGMRRSGDGVIVTLGGAHDLEIELCEEEAKKVRVGQFVRMTMTIEPDES